MHPTHVRVESSQIGVLPAQSVCTEHLVVVVGGVVVVVVVGCTFVIDKKRLIDINHFNKHKIRT